MLGIGVVNKPFFKYVIEVVHKLGGELNSYVDELIKFGEKWVNSKLRRAKYTLYKIAASLRADTKISVVGFIMSYYLMEADEALYVPDPNIQWSSVDPQYLQQMERLLRFMKQKKFPPH